MLTQSDMIVMKYNSSGEFLGVVHLPVLYLGNRSGGGTYFTNPIYFRYSAAANSYYLAGWMHNSSLTHGIIAGDTVHSLVMNGRRAESYVAAFDANTGNHLWHHIGKPGISINGTDNGIAAGIMYSSDIDPVGNIYVNTLAREFEANSVSDSAKYRTIKISPVGDVIWSYNSEKRVDERNLLVWNNNEISGFGNCTSLYIDGQWKPSYLTRQSEWRISRHSASTGAQLSHNTWLSEKWNTGITAYTNTPVCGAVDLHGNYVFGGAIGTKFYLGADSTILLQNSGSMKDCDFWIGKYGKYTCSDPIEPPTPESINTPKAAAGKIYPNPTKNELFIETEQANTQYLLYNLQGSLVQNGTVENGAPISLAALPKGIYLLHLTNPQSTERSVHKVILM
jgi:hypothetical protein